MIVECVNCSTCFQLDDERIPVTGIRVRCSRCKEAFFLQHPEASQRETVEALAASAIEDAASSFPEPASDLALGTSHAGDAASAAGLVDEDEEDWEFDHEVPARALARDPASSSGGFDAFSPSGLELDGDAESSVPARGASAQRVADVRGPFGTVDDFGSLAEGEADDIESPAAPPGTALDSDIADVIDSLSTLSVDDEAPSREDGVAGDLGEPEDWDLLGEEAPAASTRLDPEPTTDLPSTVAEPGSRPVAEQRVLRVGETRARAPRGVRLAGSAIGWLGFAGLFVGALVEGLAGSVAAGPTVNSYPVGSLVAQAVEARWATVAGGETLLVVRGVLRNPSPSAQRVGGSLAVELLDAAGRPLEHPAELAGRPLPADDLRNLASDARAARKRSAASALSGERIASGGQVEFAAYFPQVPPAARRVAVRGQESAASWLAELR